MSEEDWYRFYKEWIEICEPAKNMLKQNLKDGILKSVIDEKNSLYNA